MKKRPNAISAQTIKYKGKIYDYYDRSSRIRWQIKRGIIRPEDYIYLIGIYLRRGYIPKFTRNRKKVLDSQK